MKRVVSFFLSMIMVVGICTSMPFAKIEASAVEGSDLFTVKTNGFEDGKLVYTVYINDGVNINGSIIYAKFDTSLLAIDKTNSGAYMIDDGRGGERENIGGMYETGFMAGYEGQYSIAHAYGQGVDYNVSSTTPYMQFVFQSLSGDNIETNVDFYCYEFYSISDSENRIPNGSNAFIASISSVVSSNNDFLTFELNEDENSYSVTKCYVTATGDFVIPEKYNDLPVTFIGDNAFYGCKNLTSITIPDSVISIGKYAFYNCTSLTDVIFSESIEHIGIGAFGYCPVTAVTVNNNYVINNFDFSSFCVRGEDMETYTLKTVNIGKNISEINAANLSLGEEDFADKITNFNVDSQNEYFCSDDGVLFSKDKKTLVRYPGGRFQLDYALPDFVTVLGDYSFSGCYFGKLELSSSLKYVSSNTWSKVGDFGVVASINTLYIKSIGEWCEIDFEDKNANPLSLAKNVSFGDTDAINIKIPSGTQKIGSYSFCGYDSIKSLVVPSSVKTIGRHAFSGCSNLSSITLCPGVEKLGHYAFYGNTVLTEVLLPESVTYISRYAFSNVETIIGAKGSYAEEYADKLVYDFEVCSHNKEDCKCILCGTNLSKKGLLKAISSDVVISEEDFTIITSFDGVSNVSDLFVLSEDKEVIITSESSFFGTGSVVYVYEKGEKVAEYTLIVEGDLNGDGVCDVIDAATAQLYSAGFHDPTQNEIYAANGCISDEIDENSFQNVVNTCLAS